MKESDTVTVGRNSANSFSAHLNGCEHSEDGKRSLIQYKVFYSSQKMMASSSCRKQTGGRRREGRGGWAEEGREGKDRENVPNTYL